MSLHPFAQRLVDAGVLEAPADPPRMPAVSLPAAPPGSDSAIRYARAALAKECEAVATSAPGTRNHTLNKAAYSIGQLVAGGYLEETTAFDALAAAARTAGLGEGETIKTTSSGMSAGSRSPRVVALHPMQEMSPAYTLSGDSLAQPSSDDLDNIHRGQARLAYRLAAGYAGRLLHVPGIGWHCWDGTRWRADDSGAPTRAVLDVVRRALSEPTADKELVSDVRKCESASGIAGVLAIAGALEPVSASVSDLDADPYLLNTANGTVDLRTKTLREHTPGDRLTKVCRAAYHTDATAPRWEAFLARVLPDPEVRGFVQRLAGVALLGRVAEQILPIFTGTGANGKSVFISALSYALGDYASTAEPDLFMARQGAHPTGEMDLMGRRWVSVSESDKGRRLAEATMKRLTGGDTIRARRMRQDFVEFTPSHTAVLVTNHLPQVSGDDQAVWRRLRVVPFDVVIPAEERDPHLAEALQLEADGILAWAIQGYIEWEQRGLDEPHSVRAATDRYQTDSNDVARFIDERCFVSPQAYGTPGEFHIAYSEWARADGEAQQMSLKAFGAALAERGYRTSKSNGRRLVRGIGLLAAEGTTLV
ncbi:Uncharacterized conserved protein [Nocardia farcinica]|uniref:Uncharacterized conserved protein n=2 Tax=Nocardia farcinica TaxID=37329 RepID=A0A449G722_NOCFR|nr:Uncharacterized conserved protein [Nocardia farcinica]